MSDQKTKDLENCAEIYDEEEIQLLEDRRAGKLIYFVSWYFFRLKLLWNIILPFCCVGSAFCTWLSYSCLRDIYYRLDDTKTSELFPPSWLTIHYFLAFVIIFVSCMEERKNPIMEVNIIQKLLGEVSETDLMGDSVAWRRIAFNVNKFFVRKRYNSSIFYGGEQCRCFFVKEVVVPIDSGSDAIRTYHSGYIYTDYCKDPSNKNLAKKAVANYNKSAENYDELPHVDRVFECDKGLLEKFHTISMILILCSLAIEWVLSMTMSLAMVSLALYRAIFN